MWLPAADLVHLNHRFSFSVSTAVMFYAYVVSC